MIDVSIVGASGYGGGELLRLLLDHPEVRVKQVTSESNAGKFVHRIHPNLRKRTDLKFVSLSELEECDVLFLGLPHGTAMEKIHDWMQLAPIIIDLSADFRLRDRATYERWYGELGAPELLGQAVYGLPERYRAQLAGAELVANPGCFPTAALLALAPLAGGTAGESRWSCSLTDVVIDAKTGVSGAGRAATARTHFVAVDENVAPYGVGAHRHMPEIDQELGALGAPVTSVFTPHLLPLDQGELVSCYVSTDRRWEQAELEERYARAYADEPFVELSDSPPGVRDVRDTNVCRIHLHADARTGKLLVFAAIDNLWKGAASQAVQNLNLMFGRPEAEGIEP